LFKADEMLGPILLTQHNLHYYQALMAEMRDAIAAGRFADIAKAA
jgi:queuine tRNA-ribosyltransferase